MHTTKDGIQAEKAGLRERMKRAVAAIPAAERARMDAAATETILDLLGRHFHLGSTVLAYMPLKDEVDLTEILAECLELDATLVLPRMNEGGLLTLHRVGDLAEDLKKGPRGVPEPRAGLSPVPFSSVELSIIPGRAFTPEGHRLGRGLGCYDRALQALGGVRVGLAYDCQIVQSLPLEPHDLPVDTVITPSHVYHAPARA